MYQKQNEDVSGTTPHVNHPSVAAKRVDASLSRTGRWGKVTVKLDFSDSPDSRSIHNAEPSNNSEQCQHNKPTLSYVQQMEMGLIARQTG